MPLDTQKIEKIIHDRIIIAPEETKGNFPDVLKKEQPLWIAYDAESYLLLAFVTNEDLARVRELRSRSLAPFPGLISPDETTGAAVKVSNSRNLILKANTVINAYSLSIGVDSTIILQDHTQRINTQEMGVYEYVINLAFIIARGSEINLANQYDYLDGLIVYAINAWGGN